MINVKNKSVTILGAARSGIAAAKLLKNQKANVFVSDIAPEDQKVSEMQVLKKENIEFEFGQHSDRVFNADFTVLSPGISSKSAMVKALLAKKIPVYSELEMASWFCASPIIAITGSNGKTTTTTLVGEMLRTETPGSIVAGNIGNAFSDFVIESNQSAWATVEVSSFQLETIDRFHPRVVLILNLAPNHLDWYDSYEDYVTAKLRILKNLQETDYLVYNADDKLLAEKVQDCQVAKKSFSLIDKDSSIYLDTDSIYYKGKELINTQQIRLRGNHNYQNAMAAILAAKIAGIQDANIVRILKEFAGVEHRLEHVAEIAGITFINDSKATTVESLAVALTSFETPIVLIAGGKDKGADYSNINHLIKENVRRVILIGSAKEKIANAWHDIVTVDFSETLAQAVEMAFRSAKSGDNILLSPACSSFDMFRDFEDRGRQFKDIVNSLKLSDED
jgi:UDP-N-acetylmuramoylalanine--D-glutamate ligase